MRVAHRSLILFALVALVLFPVWYAPLPVSAGPLESFYESPLVYWDDDSVNVATSWDTDDQTVTIDADAPSPWLTGWSRRKAISITGSSGAGTNYSVRVNVTHDSDMQADFDDIRFTDDDAVSNLAYWLEQKTDSTDATFWVNVNDNLDTAETVYMYYGHSTASTRSSIDATFPFADDFNDASIDGTKWYEQYSGGSVSEAAGVLTVTGGAGAWQSLGAKSKYGVNYAYSMRVYESSDNADTITFGADDRSDDGSVEGTGIDDAKISFNDITRTRREGNIEDIAESYNYASWCYVDIQTFSSKAEFFKDGTSVNTHTTRIPTDDMGIMFVIKNVVSLYVDWAFTRKCVDTEPVSTVGSEVTSDVSLDIGVPIERSNSQAINVMADFSNTSDLVRMELYDDSTVSGHRVDVNSSHVLFAGSSMIGNTDVSHSGVVRLLFEAEASRNLYRVTVTYENDSLADIYTNYYSRGGNNWLRFTASNWDGNFTLYHISGSLNYTTLITTPQWVIDETSADADCEYGSKFLSTETLHPNHVHTASITDVPYWGYLRTELNQYSWWDGIGNSADDFYSNFSLTLEVGAWKFGLWHYFEADYADTQDWETNFTVWKNGLTAYSFKRDKTPVMGLTTEMDMWVDAEIVIWRTTEDRIAAFIQGEDGYTNDYGYGHSYFLRSKTNSSAPFQWETNETVSDYEATITLEYSLIVTGESAIVSSTTLDYFDYGYYCAHGFGQPSVAAETYVPDTGYTGKKIDDSHGMTNQPYGNPDYYFNFDFQFNLPFPSIFNLFAPLAAFLTTIGNMLLAGLARIGQEFVTAILGYMTFAVAFWTSLLNMISPGLGTTVVGGIGSIFSLFVSAFGILITFLSVISSGLTWMMSITTFVLDLVAANFMFIGLMIALYILHVWNEKGYHGIIQLGVTVTKVGFAIFGFLINIGLKILNTIANFIPLT